jgi:hypothetical protein
MDQALVVELLTTFDYRKARARDGVRHRMRRVTTRDDYLNYCRESTYQYKDSSWLFALHAMDLKQLREFAVFLEWSACKLMDAEIYAPLPSDHLFSKCTTKPRVYSRDEEAWVSALAVYSSGYFRPEREFKAVGMRKSNKPLGGYEFYALCYPDRITDMTYLQGIHRECANHEIGHRFRMNGSLWMQTVDGCIEIFLPVHDR